VAQGRSLLPAGITSITGRFERGDTVGLLSPDGEEIARGLVGLSSTELAQVCGKRLDVAAQLLGYALPKTVVHRDNMLVLTRS
jgi:glutamate 5-kinase